MKSVLLHIHSDDGQEARFQAAVDIVRAFEGHLTCLQATPYQDYVLADPFGGIYALPELMEKIREDEDEQRASIEDRLRAEGISWDWLAYSGSAAKMLVGHSWLADLLVVSPHGSRAKGNVPPPVAANVAVHARAPVLVMPGDCDRFDCSAPALVAWNGSEESCMALRAALPLLQMAEAVSIVTVTDEATGELPATEGAEFLARHGVSAELSERARDGQSVTDALTMAVTERGAAYLVMGAYGHSRLRETVLGGVTRDMLDDPPFPLLLAH